MDFVENESPNSAQLGISGLINDSNQEVVNAC